MRFEIQPYRLFCIVTAAAVVFGGLEIAARPGSASPQTPTAAPSPAQGAPPAGQPGQGQPGAGAGRGGGRGGPPQVPYEDYTGFTKLWDGSTFTNWDGERDVWTIEDGTLHADTVKTPGQHHIHYIGPNPVMKDFDLKVEFKISATGANGGIQYRSRLLHTVHGGTMADPMGKPTPAGITTMDQAIAAGITSNPQRGGGGNRGGAPGAGGPPAAGAGGVPAAGAPGAGGNRGGGGGNPPAPTAAPAPANPAAGGGGGGRPGGAAAAQAGGATAAPPNLVGRCGAGGPGPTSAPATPTSTGNIWQVSGYQFDIDAPNQYMGQLYEGQGRSIITAPGRFGRLMTDRADCSVLNPNPSSAVKPHLGKDGEWQQVEIIARGNTLVHILNGQVMSVTIDDNPDFRALQGILSLQLEGSGQIWYRNVYVKALDR